MKLVKPNCPECGSAARGTVDTIQSCAEFGGFENGEVEYCGETDVWWDEQKSNLNDAGEIELVCPKGHTWFSDYGGAA